MLNATLAHKLQLAAMIVLTALAIMAYVQREEVLIKRFLR